MEIRKDIIGWEGLYQVSNLGNIKSLSRLSYKNGVHPFQLKETILKGAKDGFGYLFYRLSNNGLQKYIKGHRAVGQAFIPNLDNKPQINHINGDKTDNRIENLERCTSSENHVHRHHTLNMKAPTPWKGVYGESNPFSLKVLQCTLGGEIVKEWIGMREASRVLKIDQSSIGRVCKGKQCHAGGFIRQYA